MRATMKVLRLRQDGLLAAGLPCGSWTFMNRATSGRCKNNIWGTERYKYIKEANTLLDSPLVSFVHYHLST